MQKETIKSYMLNLFSMFFLTMRKIRIPWKITFITMGLFSMFWVLFRVLSKPQRIDYPCVRAASPIMCSFLSWLFTMGGGIYFFNMSKAALRRKAVFLSIGLFLIASALVIFSTITDSSLTYASEDSLIPTNTPIGIPQGAIPGRVVWVWNPDATNENCTNDFGDAWDLPHNTNITVVDSMMRESIRELAGKDNLYDAWNSLFLHFNEKKGKGLVDYVMGEKIFIKLNLVGGHRVRMDANLNRIPHNRYANSQTSPQVVLSVLRQLIDVYGIIQDKIYVGDPSKNINNDYWQLWTNEFPDVNYVAQLGERGRITAESEPEASLKYSDRGQVLSFTEDILCKQLAEADYLINLAALKAHMIAGVTLTTKNHYGSFTRGSASHLHIALPNETPGNSRYRPLVDMMGHEKLGGNTLLFVVDGLYPGPDANDKPDKWHMEPFNGNWASSLFVSQDPVALESVCFDFLATEYSLSNTACSYPWISGAADYLVQAADPAAWPEGIIYDPENNGTQLGSLGVYERWNNPLDKQYALELGTGTGIDFIKLLYPDGFLQDPTNMYFSQKPDISVYPNPFISGFTISINTYSSQILNIQIHNSSGRLVYKTTKHLNNTGSIFLDAQHLETGLFFLTVNQGNETSTIKILKTRQK
jgi:hypothetical protein